MEVTNAAKDRELCPEGTHPMICVGIIDLGTQKQVYKGKEKKLRKVSFTFEIQDEEDSEGNPFYVYQRFTLGLSPKANLAKTLKAWKGITVGKNESYDIDNLLGENAFGTIAHNEGEDGTVYANITAISAPMKGVKFKKPKAELLSFYMDGKTLDTETYDKLPEYVQGIIAKSDEFLALVANRKKGKDAPGTKKK